MVAPEILYVYIITGVILLVSTFGLFGNSVIILSFYQFKDLRSKRMLLLLTQAVTDLLTSAGIVVLIAGRLLLVRVQMTALRVIPDEIDKVKTSRVFLLKSHITDYHNETSTTRYLDYQSISHTEVS